MHVDCPKGYTARFMANTWATFAVVFLAIYTANLAAFMITREEYHDFTGIEDKKLANPTHSDPPLKFGTIPFGNTEQVLKRNKPRMFKYMLPFNRSKANEGMAAIKKGFVLATLWRYLQILNAFHVAVNWMHSSTMQSFWTISLGKEFFHC